MTGTIKSTPLFCLHELSNIEPPKIRRYDKLMKEFHEISNLPIDDDTGNNEFNRLKSRNVPAKL